MIGKPEWFRRRKYTGWGFTPATWQGWVYIVMMVLPLVLLTSNPVISQTKIILIVIWALVFGADFIHIMVHLPKDERDRMHEALAERNALWAIVTILSVGIAFQAAAGVVRGIFAVDPIILVALLGGLLVKIVSNIYLDKKD